MARMIVSALAVGVTLVALGQTAHGADNGTSEPQSSSTSTRTTEIRIRVGTRVLRATLVDSRTTRDFVSLLPLSLRMSDLFGRERAARLPPALANGGRRTARYAAGDVIYWAPGPDVAVMYRRAGPSIPYPPGIVVLAKLDSAVRAFNLPGRRTSEVRACWVIVHPLVEIGERK